MVRRFQKRLFNFLTMNAPTPDSVPVPHAGNTSLSTSPPDERFPGKPDVGPIGSVNMSSPDAYGTSICFWNIRARQINNEKQAPEGLLVGVYNITR